jgi:hypothetical protein
MKKLDELDTSCVESHQTNVFAFNPKISRAPKARVKADLDFWSASDGLRGPGLRRDSIPSPPTFHDLCQPRVVAGHRNLDDSMLGVAVNDRAGWKQ